MSRQALRLDPASSAARWNLALAQRTLDSLLWLRAGLDGELVRDSLAAPPPQHAEPSMLRQLQDGAGSPGGHLFTQGEQEALARDLDATPLGADLDAALSGTDQSPERVLQRLFLVESPNRWGRMGGGAGPVW